MASSDSPRLFLLDTYGLIFRAFFGRARAAVPSMRTSTGLPTEAVYVFATMLRRLFQAHRPEYVAAVLEGEGPTFRDQEFEAYKANREAMPTDLARQLPYNRRLLTAMRLPTIAVDGYEADDVIGSLARQAAADKLDTYIVSSDKDLMQLVGDCVYYLNPMKNDEIYDAGGVKEFLGVDPPQVVELLALKGDSIDNIPGAPGVGDKGARQIIEQFGSLEAALDRAGEIQRKTYRESLQNNREQILLSKRLASIAVGAPIELELEKLRLVDPDVGALRQLYTELEFHSLLSDLAPAAEDLATTVDSLDSLEACRGWLEARSDKAMAVYLDAGEAGRLGLCCEPGRAGVAPLVQLEGVRGLLEDVAAPKRVHDAKTALKELRRRGVELRGVVDDTMLAAFLVDSSRSNYALDNTLTRRLGVQLDDNPGRSADLVRQLAEAFAEDLDRVDSREVYEDIELPLTPVLAAMEETGVLIDRRQLESLSAELEAEVRALEQQIWGLAGREFNLGSPKQLSEVLFDELKLPAPPRRGKTKSRSTAADILEALAAEHAIAAKILEYREFSKLKSTYVDALPALIDAGTGRLHTTFNQTGSATGRLSSSNPNLQNIPIRTELGRRIRAAFIAPPGRRLVAADYSQIELRVLAHVSGDRVLRDGFRKGEDIHTRTAAEVFGVPPLMVGPEERRRAKAVNFGIVYGLSPFGLSQQLGIPQAEARRYIEAYFRLYEGVRRYIDQTIAAARKEGFAKTLFGRRRPILDLDSRNPAARGFAERTAVNSPIQGTAADLIKLAMIEVDRRLAESHPEARLLLQVHDELLLEAPENETEAVGRMVKQVMEQVHQLEAPLVADVKAGANWRDMTAA